MGRLLLGTAIIGILVVVWLSDKPPARLAAPAVAVAPSPSPPSKPLSLPSAKVDATAILGQPRAKVHKLLGKPSEHSGNGSDVDKYKLDQKEDGFELSVRYARGTVAGFGLSGDDANDSDAINRHEAEIRAWLHLPENGPITVNGVDYSVTTDSANFIVVDARVAEAESEKAAATIAQANREALASALDKSLTESGIEADVTTKGKEHRTLRIECVLCGKVFGTKLLEMKVGVDEHFDDVPLRKKLSEYDFARVECSDGLQTWTLGR